MRANKKSATPPSPEEKKAASPGFEINYRSIFENACEGIFQTTPDGRFLAANPAMARILGFDSVEQLIRERTDIARQGYVDPGKRDEFKRRIERHGQITAFECQVRRRDGTAAWASETARAIRDAQGKIVFYEGFLQDITARKHVEQALLESQSLFQSFVEHIRANLFRKNYEGRYVYVNPGFCRLLGLERTQIMGKTPRELAAQLDVGGAGPAAQEGLIRGADHHEMILKTGENIELEERFHLPDGSIGHFYVIKSPVFSHDGRIIGSQGIQIDISSRKRMEEELFKSQQMLRTILDTIPQRVFWKDRNSVYVGCNKPLARDCGYDDPAKLIGKTDFETVSAAIAETFRADDREVMETGRPKLDYEEPQIKADGSTGWLRTSKVPLFDKDGKVIGVLGTYEDVTEHKRLEEQLRHAQKMDAFGQLAAGVAHDFNNILTVIQGNLSLLRMGLNSRSDEAAAIEQALNASERAANLVRQLLAFGRRHPMQIKPADFNDIVANMTKMLQRLIGEHITLQAHYAPEGAPVRADMNMLEQVLVNLAVNSRDAMPKGGTLSVEVATVTVDAQTPGAGERRGQFVRCSVADTGAGIAPEHLPHIFEPFFTTKDIGKGTGLGLATVFGIVEQHDGWVHVESKVGQGTTVRIFLPRQSATTAPNPLKRPAAEPRGGRETILIVEDEEAVRELLRLLLGRAGYRIHEARSANDALELWNERRDEIDLVITDMVMPDGPSGHEMGCKMQADKPSLKIIYCSGYSDDMLGENSPLRHNANFLEKPFEPQRLLQCVRESLDAP